MYMSRGLQKKTIFKTENRTQREDRYNRRMFRSSWKPVHPIQNISLKKMRKNNKLLQGL